MSDLSDFKRVVYEPEVRSLRARVAELEQALAESERQVALWRLGAEEGNAQRDLFTAANNADMRVPESIAVADAAQERLAEIRARRAALRVGQPQEDGE